MKALEITAPTNAQYKVWLSLLSSKGIKEHHQFFLMGEKLINEFLEDHSKKFKIEFAIYHEAFDLAPHTKKTILSKELFKNLDVLGTNFPLLILSYDDFNIKNLDQKPQGLEILCPLGDPRNLGALIRSAVGFGVTEIVLTQDATHPFLPQAMKASAGAALKMSFSITKLKLAQIPMVGENYALELHGTSLQAVSWPKNFRLWVGEEGPGLSLTLDQKRIMKFINIPTTAIESLNATISTSLALWEWKKSSSQPS